jgi:flagellar hook-basal body complex protein FliE
MTRPIGSDTSALQGALEAARRRLEQGHSGGGSPLDGLLDEAFESRLGQLESGRQRTPAAGTAAEASQEGSPLGALGSVDRELRSAERLPLDLVSGQISGPTELAVRLQRARITFNYTLAIRDRLVDAYREVMRMTV